jgi:hypothetical protein
MALYITHGGFAQRMSCAEGLFWLFLNISRIVCKSFDRPIPRHEVGSSHLLSRSILCEFCSLSSSRLNPARR